MCRPKRLSEQSGARFLQQSYAAQQALLKAQLDLSRKSITHMGERGEVDERRFIEVLRHYLPNRYSVDSAIVIDCRGCTSDQIDVVIFDRQYTPTLLDQQEHKYVPAEAVYAVLEVKPTVDKGYLEYAAEKAQSVRVLRRTTLPVVHSDGVKAAKAPFDIPSGIVAAGISWKDGFGKAFHRQLRTLTGVRSVDCGLAVSGYAFDTFNHAGGASLMTGGNALVFFLFRLLQKLQSLGTVPMIDWNAYAGQLAN